MDASLVRPSSSAASCRDRRAASPRCPVLTAKRLPAERRPCGGKKPRGAFRQVLLLMAIWGGGCSSGLGERVAMAEGERRKGERDDISGSGRGEEGKFQYAGRAFVCVWRPSTVGQRPASYGRRALAQEDGSGALSSCPLAAAWERGLGGGGRLGSAAKESARARKRRRGEDSDPIPLEIRASLKLMAGVQMVAAQLPLLLLMDCGKSLCANTQPEAKRSYFGILNGGIRFFSKQQTVRKQQPTGQKLIMKHSNLKKPSLGCSVVDASA